MSTETSGNPPVEDQKEQLRDEIADTRERLGDTVEALAEKADVKGQAKAKVEEKKEAIRDDPKPVAAVAGGVALFFVLLFALRRRRS